MSATAVYLLVFEGFADWEPAYALAELRRSGGLTVRTVGFTREAVRSMGGLRVIPDVALGEVEHEHVRLFILPGGERWHGDYPRSLLELFLQRLRSRGTPVAGICAGTVALARAGLLRGHRHTSDSPDYLAAQAPGATDPADYVAALSVRDRGLITASGLGALEFARDIFEELGVFDEAARIAWYDGLKHGRAPATP